MHKLHACIFSISLMFANFQVLANSSLPVIEQHLLPQQYLKGTPRTYSIKQMMEAHKVSGLSLAFIDNGQLLWVKAYGEANLSDRQPVTTSTVFTGASLSKPVSAVAALRLVDKGKIKLDSDVNQWLKNWQIPASPYTSEQKITLRHLLNHTSGVKNHIWQSIQPGQTIPELSVLLAGEANEPGIEIQFRPGERERYSNSGYAIVQKLIEDVTGEPFELALDKLVLGEVGMLDSSFGQPVPDRLREKLATGYSEDLQPYSYQLFPFKAAGGIWTTPTDLAHFMDKVMTSFHHQGDDFLSKGLLAQIFANKDDRLVFRIKHDAQGTIFEHWGSNAGFTSYMVGSLAQRQGLVLMTNSDNGFALMAAIARTLAHHYNWPVLKPRQLEPVTLATQQLSAYVGTFATASQPDTAMQFLHLNDTLMLITKYQPKRPLIPVGKALFFDPESSSTFEFLQGREEAVGWVRVTEASGYNNDFPKVEH